MLSLKSNTAAGRAILSFLAVLIFLFLMPSCSQKKEEKDNILVVTTVFPQYDFTREIAKGTDTEIKMLLPPGTEPHSYDMTPGDMKAASECDLFIAVGGESEVWADKIISASRLPKDKILTLMDTVPLLETASGHGEAEHSHAHTHENLNHDHIHDEHVWTSPKNAIIITEEITERLCSAAPENAEIYRNNANSYIEELTELDREFSRLSEKLGDKALVFGDRFPFLYLTNAYKLRYTSPFRGCSAHTEASLAEIADAVSAAKESESGVIFSVDFSNEKLAHTIADEVGAEVLRLYSCHTIGKDMLEEGIGYTDLMKENLENIGKALLN